MEKIVADFYDTDIGYFFKDEEPFLYVYDPGAVKYQPEYRWCYLCGELNTDHLLHLGGFRWICRLCNLEKIAEHDLLPSEEKICGDCGRSGFGTGEITVYLSKWRCKNCKASFVQKFQR